jgi:hypothetical protein
MTSDPKSNVTPFTSAPASPNGGSRNGGNAGIVERLVRLETKMENVATQKDISDLKTHISDNQNSTLKWMIATLVASVAALFAILQFFSKGA